MYRRIALYLFALSTLLSVAPLFAQNKAINYSEVKDDKNYGRYRYIEFKANTGTHLYNGGVLDGEVDSGYGSFKIRFAWQPSSEDSWTNPYGFASYGFGWYSGFIGNPKVFGKPNALFGFMKFPLSRYNRRNVMEISPAFGLTFNLEPFDGESNPLNHAIGARKAAYFSLYYGGTYRLNREMDLLYGIDFTHFSNGSIYKPNSGLNMVGINIGMRYQYNANNDPNTSELIQARFERPKSRALKKIRTNSNSLNLHAAIGTVQNDEDAGTSNRYSTFSGVLDYRYRFNEMHGLTAGLDLFYDESLQGGMPYISDWYLYAIHAGYDFMFWKMATRLQLGTYLGSDRNKKAYFIRAALQYEITPWMHTQIALKTKDGGTADWVEFGIGFTPFQW